MRTCKALALVMALSSVAQAQDAAPPPPPPPDPAAGQTTEVEMQPAEPAPAPAPAPAAAPAPAPAPVATPAPAPAPAADPVDPGADTGWSPTKSRLALSADRLMGVYLWKQTITQGPDSESEPSGTQINFLMGNAATTGMGPNPSALPRPAFDFVLGSGLTIGGSLGYSTGSGETKSTVAGESVIADDATITMLLVTPRIGYLIETSPLVSIWLRGGLSIYGFTVENPDVGGVAGSETSVAGTQISLDPALVLTPVDHFGFSISAVIDQALTGNWETTDSDGATTSENFRASSYGVSAGLVGFF